MRVYVVAYEYKGDVEIIAVTRIPSNAIKQAGVFLMETGCDEDDLESMESAVEENWDPDGSDPDPVIHGTTIGLNLSDVIDGAVGQLIFTGKGLRS